MLFPWHQAQLEGKLRQEIREVVNNDDDELDYPLVEVLVGLPTFVGLELFLGDLFSGQLQQTAQELEVEVPESVLLEEG